MATRVVGGVAALLACVILTSGCLFSSEESVSAGRPEYVVGDTWSYEGDDGSVTVRVVETGKAYDGMAVTVLNVTVHKERMTEAGVQIIDTVKTVYSAWFHLQVYVESVDTIVTPALNQTKVNLVSKRVEVDRIYPESIRVGDSWTVVTAESVRVRSFVGGALVSDSTVESNDTVSYEVVAQKDVAVPAGTFACLEIRADYETSGLRVVDFYSSSVKSYVKEVRSGDGWETESSLESY